MKYDKIEGLDKDISKLIMGNDNQTYFDEAAKLWDYWMEVGGNAFDTAYIYGGGLMEKLLGEVILVKILSYGICATQKQ